MDALFVIPSLISPTVPERLVPGLCKMVERNVALMYSSQIGTAAMKKYGKPFGLQTAYTENYLQEGPLTEPTEVVNNAVNGLIKSTKIDPFSNSGTQSVDWNHTRKDMTHPDYVELPKGIGFFNTVSLEPTIIEIPMSIRKDILGLSGPTERLIRIGIKCIQYRLEDVDNLISMLRDSKSIAVLDNYIKRKLYKLLRRSILMPSLRKVFRGEESTGDVLKDIIIGPSSEELSNSSILASLFSASTTSKWTSLVVLTSMDFEGNQLSEVLGMYRDMVLAGWGDMLVVDEQRESVHFCSTKYKSCQVLPFSYIRQMLKMDTVIDYRETRGLTKPFHMVPTKNILSKILGK